jgi:hypothetical protein
VGVSAVLGAMHHARLVRPTLDDDDEEYGW